MPRIVGVDLPLDKQIRISLRYIYGIGPVNAMSILGEAGIDPNKKARELNEDEIGRIVNIIDRATPSKVPSAAKSNRTSNASRTSKATAVPVTAAASPPAANAPAPTPAPARAHAKPSPARKASKNSTAKMS